MLKFRIDYGVFFFSSLELLFKACDELFIRACPHCHKVGHLINHSKIYRVGEEKGKPIFHGQRIYCNKRKKVGGCGRTFALNLTTKLPRLNRFTAKINAFLLHYIAILIACTAWNIAHPKCIDITASYRFMGLVKNASNKLKPLLCTICKPPDNFLPNSVLHLFLHIKQAFPNTKNHLEGLLLCYQKRIF